MENIVKQKLNFDSKHIEFLLKILNKYGESRVIGGAVRDAIIGISKTDIDIATKILPKNLIKILNKENIKNIPTGIEHGTITAFVESESFEITTLRKDIECYGRKAKVEFSDNFQEDALRRDFTINSLSYDFENKIIYDYTGGYKDLLDSKLIFIGNPEDRIREDFLRILRFFRFSSNYTKNFDQEALQKCKELAPNILSLSKERINSECKKIFDSKKYIESIEIMTSNGIMNYIFEDLNFSIDSLRLCEHYRLNPIEKIAIFIFSNSIDKITKMLKNLRFSNKEITHIKSIKTFIEKLKETNYEYSLLYYKLSDNKYIDSFLKITPIIINMDNDSYVKFFEEFSNMFIPALPINGIDLQKSGFIANQIHKGLEEAKHEWIISNFTINKNDLMKIIHSRVIG